MTKQRLVSNASRLLVAGACALASASCGSELLRSGRSPVYLTVMSVQGAAGGGTASLANPLLSDVVTNGSVFNDTGTAEIRVDQKDQGGLVNGGTQSTLSPLNAVTLTRYRVNFRRADGRNTPGVDVPYSFDGGLANTIDAGGSASVVFDLVRHANKNEPPLRNLRDAGGLRLITAIAEVTFYGRDQNGNELTATGAIDVTFADFGDS